MTEIIGYQQVYGFDAPFRAVIGQCNQGGQYRCLSVSGLHIVQTWQYQDLAVLLTQAQACLIDDTLVDRYQRHLSIQASTTAGTIGDV